MKLLAATIGAGALAAVTLTGPVAQAMPTDFVTATYGCRSATFTNHNSQTATVSYGIYGSDMPTTNIKIASGQSRTVKVDADIARHFGWGAKTAASDLNTFGPKGDLNKYCSSSDSTGKNSPAKSSGTKQSSGGLAKTGV